MGEKRTAVKIVKGFENNGVVLVFMLLRSERQNVFFIFWM